MQLLCGEGKSKLTTKGEQMSAEKTINKAFGSIPKEVTFHISCDEWIPTIRGIRYYWILFVRKLRNIK